MARSWYRERRTSGKDNWKSRWVDIRGEDCKDGQKDKSKVWDGYAVK